ncbi:PAS domain S-box protein [Paenibacillus pasadenensis]|uniref:histidine kinase n=1 Tax=Paenibacillus pasadenensis TaxID=217090 RepID=A0A2N5N9N6_9BACL|nr:PAS domain S-box protein [Paenibacillus pasadenensis]PLT47044.1 sporulation kinase A [Paenibacillus pasadenensis]
MDRELREEMDLALLWDKVEEAVYVLDPEWRFIYANRMTEHFAGKPREQLIGTLLWDLFPANWVERAKPVFEQAAATGRSSRFEEYSPESDRWYAVQALPLPPGLAVVLREITAERKNSQRLDQRYESLFRQNQDSVFQMDLEGRFVLVNPAMAAITGYSERELIGSSFEPLLHPDELPEAREHFRLAAAGQPQYREYRIINSQGHELYGQVTKFPIVVDGHVIGIFGMGRDVTLQKRSELKIREAERRLRSLIAHHSDAILELDNDGKVRECNPAGLKLLGAQPEELAGMRLDELMKLDEERRDELTRLWDGADCQMSPLALPLPLRSGETILAEVEFVPILIHGQRDGAYLILKDLTQKLETEKLLLKSEKLQTAGQLAAAVAHEIRNPLTSLKGFVRLLETYNERPEKAYMFQILQEEISRIDSITNELLMLAKPQKSIVKQVRLDGILEAVATLMSPQALLKSIELRLEPLPEAVVLGEEYGIKQVFVNLVKNAIEVMEQGEIRIELEAAAEGWHVRVADEGGGMPEECLDRLGEPFYSTKEKGTGLGLMVTKRILEAHDGTIEFRSRRHVGTVVEVYLPRESPLQKRRIAEAGELPGDRLRLAGADRLGYSGKSEERGEPG